MPQPLLLLSLLPARRRLQPCNCCLTTAGSSCTRPCRHSLQWLQQGHAPAWSSFQRVLLAAAQRRRQHRQRRRTQVQRRQRAQAVLPAARQGRQQQRQQGQTPSQFRCRAQGRLAAAQQQQQQHCQLSNRWIGPLPLRGRRPSTSMMVSEAVPQQDRVVLRCIELAGGWEPLGC